MLVRITSSVCVLSGEQLRRGAVMELPAETARVLIDTNQAEAVESQEQKSAAKSRGASRRTSAAEASE